MKLAMLVLTGLAAAGCAATRTEPSPQPPDLEDGAWGHDGSLVSDAGPADAAPARTAASSDVEAAVASVTAASDGRGAGADGSNVVTETEGRVYDWLRRDRAYFSQEERLVGSNDQPEWTTQRRFTTTQAYVLAPGQIVLEQSIRTQAPKHEGPRHLFQTSANFGFAGGFEVDVAENWGRNPNEDHVGVKHIGFQGEVRYAFGKWGTIPLNPTIVGGFIQNHRAPDVAELKVSLATDFGGGGWHWAGDIAIFRETETRHLRDLQATMGISRAICDSKWSIGAEGKFDSVSVRHHRSDPENQLLIGPSLQWRPTPNTHLDITPLFGLVASERKDPRVELQIVFGIDFGPEQEDRRRDRTNAN